MKRRRQRERDEEDAREQADARREALLAELRARQAGEDEPAERPTGEVGNEPSGEEPSAEEPASDEPGDAA